MGNAALEVAPVGVHRAEYHLICEYHFEVEMAGVDREVAAAGADTGQANNPVRADDVDSFEGERTIAGRFDDEVDRADLFPQVVVERALVRLQVLRARTFGQFPARAALTLAVE